MRSVPAETASRWLERARTDPSQSRRFLRIQIAPGDAAIVGRDEVRRAAARVARHDRHRTLRREQLCVTRAARRWDLATRERRAGWIEYHEWLHIRRRRTGDQPRLAVSKRTDRRWIGTELWQLSRDELVKGVVLAELEGPRRASVGC